MKTVLSFLAALVVLLALASPVSAQTTCSVTSISLSSAPSSSSTCTPGPIYPLAVQITGTWVGSVTIDQTDNNGNTWAVLYTFTANVSFMIPPAQRNVGYRMTFATRTSGTVTGSLLGENPAVGRRIFTSVPVGSVAYASFGNNTTLVAGTLYCTDVVVPRAMTVSSIDLLNGNTVGTDNHLVVLYDAAGNLLGNSATAGALAAGANAFQDFALVTNVAINPGLYYFCGQSNGTTATLSMQAANTFVDTETSSTSGTFGTIPTVLTIPTTFTANVGPIGYLKGF